MIRIAIVNDVKMAIEVLRRVVTSIGETQVAWIAENGCEAVDKCRADRPDLVLMDLIMPEMDGVEATRRIMQHSPCPILVVTATVEGNSNRVFEALGHGALDAVNTPVLGRDGSIAGADALVRKIRDIVRLQHGRAAGLDIRATASHRPATPPAQRQVPLLVIGASTGGPQALATVLADIPPLREFSAIIVQHLDPVFVPGLVAWLSQATHQVVRQVELGARPQPGTVHVACTADHLVLSPTGEFQYVAEPVEHVYRPSVDVFFQSLLAAQVEAGIALLLTGMGRDGAAGMKALQRSGWKTYAQDEASSIVWGMPGAAVQLQAADRVLPLTRLGPAIAHDMKQIISTGVTSR